MAPARRPRRRRAPRPPPPPSPRWPGWPARAARAGRRGRRPSAVTSSSPAQPGVGAGTAEPARARPVRRRRRRRSVPVHAGQPTASWRHSSPAATHITLGGTLRRPHHQRVVGVGHHRRLRGRARAPAPPARHHPHLAHPVELIARQVEQRHHLGGHGAAPRRRDRPRPPRARPARPGPPSQGRGQPRRQVGPGRRRGHPARPPRAAASRRVVVVLPLVPRHQGHPAARGQGGRGDQGRGAAPRGRR